MCTQAGRLEYLGEYLGGLFLPHLSHAIKHVVPNEPLPTVAWRLRDHTQGASLLWKLSGFKQSVTNEDPNTRGILEQPGSPALPFSNITRAPVGQVDLGFGLGALRGAQMLQVDARP
ncbi:hypothetical protein GGI25_004349 [Coemansia spiralis]|uniref:Uncharacterized protein n=2 Tax=Coemansia TaxID=4863 RepID=A0A9W8G6B5_9FUNG|nr:hypothetical protein EDC05_003054 [Coemansia umbellata]KAJ2621434.1 hypothetical protein GGI26_004116 [Coemansia sp. RSA 1358]KAJ2674409.1 hypothetical protein GGI25_004349 [Coemansia spiralis]